MSDFKAALYTFLTSQAPITAVVDLRIFPDLAQASTRLPYVTYQRVNYELFKHLDGISPLTNAPYPLDIWGGTEVEAEQAMLAIRDTLDNFRGFMGSIFVPHVLITTIIDGLEEPTDGLTLGTWRHSLTADIWYVP